MNDIVIAKRYAKAAIQTLTQQQIDTTLNQIHLMREIFASSDEVKQMLVSPYVDKKKKLDFITEVLKDVKNNEFWKQLMKVIVLQNRSQIMQLFFTEFEIMLYQALGQRKVSITFAHQPDDETKSIVKNEIERILKSNIVADIRVDKGIIGGFIAIDKNTVIDASVASHLSRFSSN